MKNPVRTAMVHVKEAKRVFLMTEEEFDKYTDEKIEKRNQEILEETGKDLGLYVRGRVLTELGVGPVKDGDVEAIQYFRNWNKEHDITPQSVLDPVKGGVRIKDVLRKNQ